MQTDKDRFSEYPKLRDLVAAKDDQVKRFATPPMFLKVRLAPLGGWFETHPAFMVPSASISGRRSLDIAGPPWLPGNTFLPQLTAALAVQPWPAGSPNISTLPDMQASAKSLSCSALSVSQADLKELPLKMETFGTKFDVVLIDPPWEEYVRRAPGADSVADSWPWQVRNPICKLLAAFRCKASE